MVGLVCVAANVAGALAAGKLTVCVRAVQGDAVDGVCDNPAGFCADQDEKENAARVAGPNTAGMDARSIAGSGKEAADLGGTDDTRDEVVKDSVETLATQNPLPWMWLQSGLGQLTLQQLSGLPGQPS